MSFSSARTLVVAAGLLTVVATSVNAEIRGVMELCSGGRLCPWFQAVVSPPAGWAEDEAASHQHHLTMLVPRGATFASAPARIYASAFLNTDKTPLEERVRVSHSEWMSDSPRTSVERLADVKRTGGRPPFQVYRYRNPDRIQQPVELTAFGEELDAEGRPFGILIVLSATSARELARRETSYRTLLERF